MKRTTTLLVLVLHEADDSARPQTIDTTGELIGERPVRKATDAALTQALSGLERWIGRAS